MVGSRRAESGTNRVRPKTGSPKTTERRQAVERSWNVARYLANKGPKTTKELAVQFGVSKRIIFRIMAALERAHVPIFQRKPPGLAPLQWDIDTGRLFSQFQRESWT